jgi:hypothetical protein
MVHIVTVPANSAKNAYCGLSTEGIAHYSAYEG